MKNLKNLWNMIISLFSRTTDTIIFEGRKCLQGTPPYSIPPPPPPRPTKEFICKSCKDWVPGISCKGGKDFKDCENKILQEEILSKSAEISVLREQNNGLYIAVQLGSKKQRELAEALSACQAALKLCRDEDKCKGLNNFIRQADDALRDTNVVKI